MTLQAVCRALPAQWEHGTPVVGWAGINKVLQVKYTSDTAGTETAEPVGLSSVASRQAQWQDWRGHRDAEGCETMEVFLGKENMVFWEAVIILNKTVTILFNSTKWLLFK